MTTLLILLLDYELAICLLKLACLAELTADFKLLLIVADLLDDDLLLLTLFATLVAVLLELAELVEEAEAEADALAAPPAAFAYVDLAVLLTDLDELELLDDAILADTAAANGDPAGGAGPPAAIEASAYCTASDDEDIALAVSLI